MKVSHEPILQLLEQLKALTSGMVQGSREWCTDESTRDMIEMSCSDMEKLMVSFIANNLTPPDEEIKIYEEPGYLKRWEKLVERKEREVQMLRATPWTVSEIRDQYKGELFARLMRELRTAPYQAVPNCELINWIENNIVGQRFHEVERDRFYSAELMASSDIVLNDIVANIIVQRKKAPQQKLFN